MAVCGSHTLEFIPLPVTSLTTRGSAIGAQHRQRDRRGVTLMETLIAIFVVGVGLLGLVALLPIGRWQMVEAARVDRGAVLGRSAFRNLTARAQLRMENWSYCVSPTAGQNPAILDVTVQPPFYGFRRAPAATDQLGKLMTPPYAPLVFDPLMVAYNKDSDTTLQAVRTFPYELTGTPTDDVEWNGAPRLARVTLFDPLNALLGQKTAMRRTAAETYFRGTDDRVFAMPENRELKPSSQFTSVSLSSGGGGSTVPAATQSLGDFSWFAVVNPDPFEITSAGLGARKVRQFSVSVVVCHKRPLVNLNGKTYTNRDRTRGERRALLDFISSASFTQGSTDAWMTMSDLRNRDEADQATTLRTGEWLMVMSFVPIPGQQSAEIKNYVDVQWFRVLSVGRNVYQVNGDVWKRRIRLTGNTWSVPSANSSSGSALAPGYAVIVDGAVGVFRKTLINDGTSLWSP